MTVKNSQSPVLKVSFTKPAHQEEGKGALLLMPWSYTKASQTPRGHYQEHSII